MASNQNNYTALIQAAATQYGLSYTQLNGFLNSQQGFNQLPATQGGLSAAQIIDGYSQAFSSALNQQNGNVANAVLSLQNLPFTAQNYTNNAGTILASGGTIPAVAGTDNFYGDNLNGTGTNGAGGAALNNAVVSTGTNFLQIFKAGGWSALLLIIAGIGIYFGLSGLIKGDK